MAAKTRRILIGQLFHETHGFNPQRVTAEKVAVARGEHLIEKARGTGTTLGGIVGKLAQLGYEIVPTLGFVLPPSGPIEHGFYLSVRDELLHTARRERYDAIALDLHGAMCTTELTDVEGDLLTHLRAVVGPDVPIGIGLDMHAHVTGAMLREADVCIACKESPHTDFPECGARVVECLVAMLDGELNPVRVMAKVPMINLDGGFTAAAPLSEIKQRARALQAAHREVWDCSLYQVYRFADYDEEKGMAAVVLAHDSADAATRIAEELAREFWINRELFRDDYLEIDAAFDIIEREVQRRPFVLADIGDRVLAGAPGDSTAILSHALRRADRLRGVIPITDPASVLAAQAAGIGARLHMSVGGRLTPGFSPLDVDATVLHLSDGEFEITGAVFGGERSKLGRTAVVQVDGRLTLLLTSEAGLTHTPSAFSSQGIDVRAHDFVVVKSGMHFQANFAGLATPLLLSTPGLCFPAKGFFPWRNARFWPEHDIGEPLICARVFASRQELPSEKRHAVERQDLRR
jgi:microcystin degradation protein MlrC